MKKNILMGIMVLVLVLTIGFLLTMDRVTKYNLKPIRNPAGLSQALYQKDEAELDSFGDDLALSGGDLAVSSEVDQTFDDILDTNELALDEDSISKEATDIDLSGELNASASDDVVLKEADQALVEVAQ